jgi:hypothetical protein
MLNRCMANFHNGLEEITFVADRGSLRIKRSDPLADCRLPRAVAIPDWLSLVVCSHSYIDQVAPPAESKRKAEQDLKAVLYTGPLERHFVEPTLVFFVTPAVCVPRFQSTQSKRANSTGLMCAIPIRCQRRHQKRYAALLSRRSCFSS